MIVVVACASMFVLPVQGMAQCNNKLLKGLYDGNCVEHIEGGAGRFNANSILEFGGDGTFEGTDVQRIEAVPSIIRTAFCGTYEVSERCELEIVFNDTKGSLADLTCDSGGDPPVLATFEGGVFASGIGATLINTGFFDAGTGMFVPHGPSTLSRQYSGFPSDRPSFTFTSTFLKVQDDPHPRFHGLRKPVRRWVCSVARIEQYCYDNSPGRTPGSQTFGTRCSFPSCSFYTV